MRAKVQLRVEAASQPAASAVNSTENMRGTKAQNDELRHSANKRTKTTQKTAVEPRVPGLGVSSRAFIERMNFKQKPARTVRLGKRPSTQGTLADCSSGIRCRVFRANDSHRPVIPPPKFPPEGGGGQPGPAPPPPAENPRLAWPPLPSIVRPLLAGRFFRCWWVLTKLARRGRVYD